MHVGDYENVHFTVNKSGLNPNYIQVYVHRNDAAQLNVSVYYEESVSPGYTITSTETAAPITTTDTAPTPTATTTDTAPSRTPTVSTTPTDGGIASMQMTGFTNILISVLAVLGVVFIQDKRQYMVVILIMGICFLPLMQLIQAQQPSTADIDIYIPKYVL